MIDKRGGFGLTGARVPLRLLLGTVTGMMVIAGCSNTAAPDDSVAERSRTSVRSAPDSPGAQSFPAGQPFDYQLGGQYPPPQGAKLVVRDSTAAPAAELYSICYVNGFQTQPEERDVWLRDRSDLILTGRDGRALVDENWPDELILDTSTGAKRTRLADIIKRTIATCATKGFKAVEFDNLDSNTRSRGALTADDNLQLATTLAKSAHDAGLAVGQKNSAELAEKGRQQAGFDFAVAEECLRFQECARYSEVYARYVIDIEYTDDLPSPLDTICAQPDRPASTIIRDRKLVAHGTAGYFYRSC